MNSLIFSVNFKRKSTIQFGSRDLLVLMSGATTSGWHILEVQMHCFFFFIFFHFLGDIVPSRACVVVLTYSTSRVSISIWQMNFICNRKSKEQKVLCYSIFYYPMCQLGRQFRVTLGQHERNTRSFSLILQNDHIYLMFSITVAIIALVTMGSS